MNHKVKVWISLGVVAVGAAWAAWLSFDHEEQKYVPMEHGVVRWKQVGGHVYLVGNESVIHERWKFDDAGVFNDGVAAVRRGSKWAIINVRGELLTEFVNDDIRVFSEGLTACKMSTLWGCVNIMGDVVIPFEYENLYGFHGGCSAAKKDGRWGLISRKNETVIPFEYSKVRGNKMGWFVGLKDDGWEVIDVDRQKVQLVLKAIEVELTDDGYLIVCQNTPSGSRYGLIDLTGRVLLPTEYLNVLYAYGGVYLVVGEDGRRREVVLQHYKP